MKKYILIAVMSVILFLVVCWSAAFKIVEVPMFVEALCFLLFTYWVCKKYTAKGLSAKAIIISVIIGRYILELPGWIFYFSEIKGSGPVSIACLVGILLGYWCYKNNTKTAWAVSAIVVVLCPVLGHFIA
jgi:hypothetical protein